MFAPFLATVIELDPALPPTSTICTVSPATRDPPSAVVFGNVIVIPPAVHKTLSLTLAEYVVPVETVLVEYVSVFVMYLPITVISFINSIYAAVSIPNATTLTFACEDLTTIFCVAASTIPVRSRTFFGKSSV